MNVKKRQCISDRHTHARKNRREGRNSDVDVVLKDMLLSEISRKTFK